VKHLLYRHVTPSFAGHSVGVKQRVISVAFKTLQNLETRLVICIYKTPLLHRPDDYIGFTPSLPHISQQNCADDQVLLKKQATHHSQNNEHCNNYYKHELWWGALKSTHREPAPDITQAASFPRGILLEVVVQIGLNQHCM